MRNFIDDLDLKHSYTSIGDSRITTDFLIPAMKCATVYQRSVGFFSSSVIGLIMDGVIALSRNQGVIQIVASPRLSEEDVAAITLGYKQRDQVINETFSHDFEQAMDDFDDEILNLLSALIARGTLDIKIAVTNTIGIYHDKLGILEDWMGNKIPATTAISTTAAIMVIKTTMKKSELQEAGLRESVTALMTK